MNGTSAPIWPQWQQLTRLLFSGQIAFNAELARWNATEVDADHGVRLRDRTMGSKYRVTLEQHLSAITERGTFYGVILVKAHSLMEAHGKYVRHILNAADYALIARPPADAELQVIHEIELPRGIEVWGQKLLRDMGRDWQTIDGKTGLVQTSIIRNAIAHGYPRVTHGMAQRATARGADLPYAVGDEITLSFEQCRQHLARMKSFCRRLDGGVVNLAKV